MAEADTSSPAASTVRLNQLLRQIPTTERDRLTPDLHLVDLQTGSVLYAAGAPISHVYFPLTCVISVLTPPSGDDDSVEISTTGSEGVVGLPAFLGATTSPHQTSCQVPGQALSLNVAAMRRFFADDGALHELMLRHTAAVMVFTGQNVACNRLHSTRQRCARWLAQTHDRARRDSFYLRQESLAQMLGVRRAAVSVHAGSLQQDGLIRYSRGNITITDPAGLHAAACRCYHLVRHEFHTLDRPPTTGHEHPDDANS